MKRIGWGPCVLAWFLVSVPPAGSASLAPALDDLVNEYLDHDASTAVLSLTRWAPEQIERERRPAAPSTDGRYLAGLSGLLTEAGIARGIFGRARPGRAATGQADQVEIHFQAAFESIGELVRRGKDGPTLWLPFCRQWYVLGTNFNHRLVPDTVARTLPDDPRMLLLRGAYAEYWAGPAVDDISIGFDVGAGRRGNSVTTSHGRFGPMRTDAEMLFRRAIQLDPTLSEARLRLGRLWYLLDRPSAAVPELEQALKDATTSGDEYVAYLAALFLARIREDRGQVEQAIQSYQTALGFVSGAQTAVVSLARLRVRSGEATEGWATLREVSGRQSRPAADNAPDPWYHYSFAQPIWDLPAQLAELRRLARQ